MPKSIPFFMALTDSHVYGIFADNTFKTYFIRIFHAKTGSAFLTELSHGWRNLISGRDFDGTLGGYETAALVETTAAPDRRGSMEQTMRVNEKEYRVQKLLGKGKGGYSYLVSDGQREYVLKQIHHEPCDYYQFGNKMEAETSAYDWLKKIGIRMPELIEVDVERERILKEYIEGDTIYELIRQDKMQPDYMEQIGGMCRLLYAANTNIDYFPTNFVVRGGEVYYIDFECNAYMEEWNFENWGVKYWSKTPEFMGIKI